MGARELGVRHFQPDADHDLLEEVAVLGFFDRAELGADQLHAEAIEHARLRKLDRQVERGLAADRRQQGVGPFALDDLLERRRGHRLDIGPICQLRVGHDGGRVRVDEDEL